MLPFLLVLLAVTAMGAGTVVALDGSDDPMAACEETIDVRIAAAEEMAPVLGEATRDLESDSADVGGACIDYEVEIAASNQFLKAQAAAEPEEVPDLWVPDFSVWTSRTALSGLPLATLSKSVASSPVVVVSPQGKQPASWREVGMNTVAYLDPLSSSASTSALLSAFGEAARTGATRAELGAMMVPLAQRYGAQPDKPATPADVAKAAGKGTFGVMTEQQLVSLQDSGKAKGLGAAVPKSGTMVLDYPLTALSQDESVKETGRILAKYLSGKRGLDLLAVHGFRDPEAAPLASGEGLGSAELKPLSPPTPDQVTAAMRQWEVLTVPSKSLAVVDVSGSMDFTDKGRKRISIAISAAKGALELFPDNAELGLWAFSIGLGGGNQDYLSLLPVRPLGGTTSGGVSHRESLMGVLRELPSMTAGGTGLYDTTLAAVRSLRADYDEEAVNTVILLTDGRNEDPRSISLKELLSKLERERDPGKPLEIIAIGMGPQADAKALERIADVTGGKSYVARDPSDIAKVFIDAMLQR
ncbi:MAG TPA: substrate-binding domain-containing protein [Nocardioidaceae bacterium]|nr:substrate-binding domain-containing protein [Nocardioidaceae bacterium]